MSAPAHSFRLRVLGVIAASALALAGCSAPDEQPGTGTEPATQPGAVVWEDVQAAGVLNVGTEGTYRPFSYHDGDALTGYDVEVIEAIGDHLGVEINFHETQWDGMFAGLDSGRFQTIANQVSITPEREALYLFSTPYTVSRGVIVTRADNTAINSFDDLQGVRTAQSLTSNWGELARESGAEVEGVEGWAQSVALLEQGRVDATINDQLTVLDYLQTEGNGNLRIAAETDDESFVGFPFPQGSESTVEAFDGAIADLQADGTLAEISERYFGEDVSGS